MESKEIVPKRAEFSFLLRVSAIMILGVAVALTILFALLNRDLNITYALAIQAILDIFRKLNLWIVFAILAQFLISTFLIYSLALLFSHRIAGPIYRLKVILKQYVQEQATKPITFRRTDFLLGVARRFNEFFAFLSKREHTLEEIELRINRMKDLDEREQAAERDKIKTLIAEFES